jgi:hypothetical protein
MRRSTVAALVGAAGMLIPGAAAVGGAVAPEAQRAAPAKAPAKQVAVTQASVLTTPGSVTLSKDGKRVTVQVQYQCRNSKQYKHYVTGSLQQGWEESAVTYGFGWRNDGGIREARCTGKQVTERITYKQSGWTASQGKTLTAGPAELSFALSRHNAQGSGWYTVHSTASVSRTVPVRTP